MIENKKSAENLSKFERAYIDRLEAGNELPDFDCSVTEKDAPAIVSECGRLGIKGFTISAAFLAAKPVIAAFTRLGCALGGTVLINSASETYSALIGGELTELRGKIPAFKIIVG